MCMYCDILSITNKFAFVAIVSDFLFVICVQKTILMNQTPCTFYDVNYVYFHINEVLRSLYFAYQKTL